MVSDSKRGQRVPNVDANAPGKTSSLSTPMGLAFSLVQPPEVEVHLHLTIRQIAPEDLALPFSPRVVELVVVLVKSKMEGKVNKTAEIPFSPKEVVVLFMPPRKRMTVEVEVLPTDLVAV